MNRQRVPALTAFRGRAGDHNDRAMSGSALLAAGLAQRLGVPAHEVSRPEPARNADWETELPDALPALAEMAERYRNVLDSGAVPVTALSRCAVALATLPLIAQQRPDACVVWLDAHADLNTPQNSETGYLGAWPSPVPSGSGTPASVPALRRRTSCSAVSATSILPNNGSSTPERSRRCGPAAT